MTKPALGRVLNHDERSRSFPAPYSGSVVSVTHKRHANAWDQKDIGACTGYAMAGALMTEGLWDGKRKLNAKSAVSLYSTATTLDNADGSYPPDDTGSSGLAVAKAAQQKGYIKSYSHAFGFDHALAALVLNPLIIGVNWYESMFDPAEDGEVTIASKSKVAGGHEFQLHEIDGAKERVWAYNSWGTKWGVKGRFWLSYATLQRLLAEDGDATAFEAA